MGEGGAATMNTDGVAALHRLSSLLWLIIKKNFEAGKIAFPKVNNRH